MVYFIYARLLVHATVLLTYSKGYVLFLRLIYVKHIVVTLFLPKAFTKFHYNI